MPLYTCRFCDYNSINKVTYYCHLHKHITIDNMLTTFSEDEIKLCEYYYSNRSEKTKQYYENDKESKSKAMKKWYANNRELRLEQHKQYYQSNKEQIQQRSKKYRQNNKEKIKQQRHKYRQNKIQRQSEENIVKADN